MSILGGEGVFGLGYHVGKRCSDFLPCSRLEAGVMSELMGTARTLCPCSYSHPSQRKTKQ